MTISKQVTLHGYPVELNDRLWDLNMDWCTVIELNPGDQFSIRLKMDKGGEMVVDPKQMRSLFWQPVEIIPPPKPEPELDWSKVPQGTPVEVRNYPDGEWVKGYGFIAKATTALENQPFIVATGYAGPYNWRYCRLAPDVEIKPEWLKK